MNLYSTCVTKAGDVLMLITATGQPVLGRREIAHFQFERYLLKKEVLDSRP